MEYAISVWQITIIALVAGALIGALAYRLLSPSVKQADKIKAELDQTRQELGSYKVSVSQHFDKTSELVHDLTKNYVKVYQHLAEGAQTLGDNKTFTNLLEQHQGKVSISVDDETIALNKVTSDSHFDTAVAKETPVETVDEHAEPFTDLSTGEADLENLENDSEKTKASKASGNIDDPAEAMEPVLNVDALEEVTENADTGARTEAGSAISENKNKNDVRKTMH